MVLYQIPDITFKTLALRKHIKANVYDKVGPGQKFPWVKAGKNPIRHVIAYTLNMDEMIVI